MFISWTSFFAHVSFVSILIKTLLEINITPWLGNGYSTDIAIKYLGNNINKQGKYPRPRNIIHEISHLRSEGKYIL